MLLNQSFGNKLGGESEQRFFIRFSGKYTALTCSRDALRTVVARAARTFMIYYVLMFRSEHLHLSET